MHILFLVWLLIPILVSAQPSRAQDYWQDVTATRPDGPTPVGERFYRLRDDTLLQALARAPLEDAGIKPVTITLPTPGGQRRHFDVFEAPVMAPELRARYPTVRSYRGYSVDTPVRAVHLSLTGRGLHAQILGPDRAVYLNPAADNDPSRYRAFDRRAAEPPDTPFVCHFEDAVHGRGVHLQPRRVLPAPRIREGTTLRTYRTAIAATGEYTAFHGGTIESALEAIAIALVRVNGIYERDFAVRLQLVADNDRIIFTDPGTDPYSNSDGSAMLDQNQITVDDIIGPANYDLGHVFSTGGGGVASLWGPCDSDGFKARGVTGLPAPIGDVFYVDYVAHEMGHQFGALHTFNGTAGFCSGNRSGTSAYEPGSGSTIMAYAGICDSDNLQINSDPYFHVISLEQITDYINGRNNPFDLSGDICPVKTPTGNSPPEVDAGPDSDPAHVLPVSTPFMLTASASDVDDFTLSHAWEEFDLGPAGSPNSPSGNAPILRSFPPTDSATRVFPRRSDLLANTTSFGELLPNYARDLNFRVTVRDGRGGITTDLLRMRVDDGAGPFRVTSPNTAVDWPGDSLQTVTWEVANTQAAPVNCTGVDVLFSGDGGLSFQPLTGADNTGSTTVRVPNVSTTQARIQVRCNNNVFFDISDADSTVTAVALPIILEDDFESE